MRSDGGKAGGFFLTLGILAGLVGGVLVGNTMIGVLVGTLAGIVVALATWVLDQRRAP